MIVTIEGFDGVGKTTLALKIAKELNFRYVKSPIKDLFSIDENTALQIFNSVVSFDDKYLNAMFLEINNVYALKSNINNNVVIDRHIILNYIWNYEKSTKSIFEQSISYGGKPDLVIILSADKDTLVKRLINRNPQDKDIELIEKLDINLSGAIKFLDDNLYNYAIIDTNNKSSEDVLSEALDIIKKAQLKSSIGITENHNFYDNYSKISWNYNITAYYNKDENLVLRQINNDIKLSDLAICNLKKAMCNNKIVNIVPKYIHQLIAGTITANQLENKVSVFIFVSSYGMYDGTKMVSNQPSEGIYVLSEWLAKNEPTCSPVAIDPNMIDKDDLINIILNLTAPTQNVVLGFSMLPVNAENDIKLMCELKKIVPNAKIVIGGIGSEAWSLIPTVNGEYGLDKVIPIEKILIGTGLDELSELSRKLAKDFRSEFKNPPDFIELYDSRISARKLFIPYDKPDLFHKIPYNYVILDHSDSIVSVLIDNRCPQNCYFCSSPKQKVIDNVIDAVNYIEEKSKDAKVIAFNDNDLSNNSKKTISLCREMIRRGINQFKHGKMGVRNFDKELIDALSDANFQRIAIGVESFDDDIRNSLGKSNFKIDIINDTLTYLLEKKIIPEINLIIATPKETRQSLSKTITTAIKWIKKGCTVFTTTGLVAVVNAPAVMKLLKEGFEKASEYIEFNKFYVEGMSSAIYIPTYWKTSDEFKKIREELIIKRKNMFMKLKEQFGVEMPVPTKHYVTLIIIAEILQIDGYCDKNKNRKLIEKYCIEHCNLPYVNI